MTAAPTRFPVDDAAWPAFLTETVDANLEAARTHLATLKDGTTRTSAQVLDLWDAGDLALGRASAAAHLLAEVHPDADLRSAAEAGAQAAEDLGTERELDRDLWEVLAATTEDDLDASSRPRRGPGLPRRRRRAPSRASGGRPRPGAARAAAPGCRRDAPGARGPAPGRPPPATR